MKHSPHAQSTSIISIVFIWFVIVIIWGAYRYFVYLPEVADELVFKPFIFVGPVLIYLGLHKRLSPSNLGLKIQSARQIMLLGVGLGLALALENVLVRYLKDAPLNLNLSFLTVITFGVTSLATAVSEEILYRGFLLEQCIQRTQRVYLSNLFVTGLFTLGHVGISLWRFHYTGVEFLSYLLIIFINGFVTGFIYTQTRSIYASAIAHAIWNFSNGLIG